MIIPDVNLLLYAYTDSSADHRKAARWWANLLNGSEDVRIPWIVIIAFIRVLTNPRAINPAVPLEHAIAAVEGWLDDGHVRVVQPGPDHGSIVFKLLRSAGTGGNLTTDAHIAAIAIEYNAVVHTNDTDFARFPGCRYVNPLEHQ